MEEYKPVLSDYLSQNQKIELYFIRDEEVMAYPPDEKLKYLEKKINQAKESFDKKLYDRLFDIVKHFSEIMNHYNNLITESFLRQTDFCKLLIEIAADSQNYELQLYGIIVISQLMNISNESIDEFIDLYGMKLFAQISYKQKVEILLLGYQILIECLNTKKGLGAFLAEEVIYQLFDTFTTFLHLQKLSKEHLNCLQQISYIFLKLLNQVEFIPKELGIPKKILEIFINALKANYNQFYIYSMQSATLIVQKLSDEGNEILFDVKFIDEVKNELNTGIEERLIPLLELLTQIFSQPNKELKIEILNKLSSNLLEKHFLNAEINSNSFILITNLICNCFICGFSYQFILEQETVNKINEVFENAKFASKEAVTKCLMTAAYYSSYVNKIDFEKILNSKIMISAIQTIPSISEKDSVIKMLKVLNDIIGKKFRFDVECYPQFENEVEDVLTVLMSFEDSKISYLSDSIMMNYFSEHYFNK